MDLISGVVSIAYSHFYVSGGQCDDRSLPLDPSTVYTVHVYARGRQNSRDRYKAAMGREEWGAHEGFEDYVLAFIPAGHQPKPQPTRDRGRRSP